MVHRIRLKVFALSNDEMNIYGGNKLPNLSRKSQLTESISELGIV